MYLIVTEHRDNAVPLDRVDYFTIGPNPGSTDNRVVVSAVVGDHRIWVKAFDTHDAAINFLKELQKEADDDGLQVV